MSTPTNSTYVQSSSDCTNYSVILRLKKPQFMNIYQFQMQCQFQIQYKFNKGMLLQWALIMSVTLVSATMLMVLATYLAILPQAELFFGQGRTQILLFSNSFNIFYIVLSPLLFNVFNKNYFIFVIVSSIATGAGAIGRYLAGDNYWLTLTMTGIIAIAHIPIITAPYGLLKLFPDWQKGYAASIPLFLPGLGINFCILYGMIFISDGQQINTISWQQKTSRIYQLNKIIAVTGTIATVLTVSLLFKLRHKITEPSENQQQSQSASLASKEERDNMGLVEKACFYIRNYRFTIVMLVSWGSIVGVNWTYGSLFGVIFSDQKLSGKQIALIGLSANLSTAIFSNLGTFIRNRFDMPTFKVISYLNMLGIVAAILIQYSKYVTSLQNLYVLIGLIVVMRAGFSSFVSLAFIQMEHSKISSVIISGVFFWVANVVNLLGMEMVDLINSDISMMTLMVIVCLCIHFVSESYILSNEQSQTK